MAPTLAQPRVDGRAGAHRDRDAALVGHFDRPVVAGVDVADHAHARIVGEHPLELLGGEVGAVGDADLAGVDRAADADAAAVVDAHPGGARARVDEAVEERPVGDRVRPVDHRLGLAVGRGDRARVEVIAADHDRRLQFTGTHHLIEAQPEAVSLPVAEPADARRQALERDRARRPS